MKREGIYLLVVFGILLIIPFLLASPLVSVLFPSNETLTQNTSIEINMSIIDSALGDFIYDWNGTNYTFYNNSLVAMYNFDNRSELGENNSLFVDTSFAGFNGTGINGVVVNTASCKYGNCVQFDGSNDYINVSAIGFGQAFTVSMWIYPAAWGALGDAYIHNVFCNENGVGTSFCFRLGSQGNSGLKQRIAVAIYQGGSANDLESSSDLSLNTWQHVAAAWDGTNIRFYINGALDRTQSASLTMDSGTHVFMIGSSPEQNRLYQGLMDEIFIYNRTLNNAEIYQHYVSHFQKINSTLWGLYLNQSKNSTVGLDEGTYTYQGFVINSSGTQNQTGTMSVTIDTTSPVINITSPINNTNSSDNTLDVTYTISDVLIDTCLYSNDTMSANTTLESCANITSVVWAEGQHNITIWANDTVGNINSSSVIFNIDSIKPTWQNNKTNITSSLSSGSTVYVNITLNDTNPGQYIFSWYNSTAWANDTAANYTNGQEINIVKNLTSSSGNVNWTWYFNDSFGNINQSNIWNITLGTTTQTTTTNTVSSSSSSSSGGGGDYMWERKTNTNELKISTKLSPNRILVQKITEDKGTGIKEIELKSKNWLSGEILISYYDNVPDFCSIEYVGKNSVYKVLDFKNTISDESIDSGRLRIGIDKDWIYSNEVEEIKFVKCFPEYQEIKSSYITETEEEGIYDVYINGFSSYAIFGTLFDSENSSLVDEEEPDEQQKEPFGWGKAILLLLVLVLIALIILLIKHRVYLKEKIHGKFFDFEFKLRIGKK